MGNKKTIESSASGFLNRKIQEAGELGNKMDFDEFRNNAWRELGESLIVPASGDFKDGNEMFREMKEGHYLLPTEFGEIYIAALCDTWVEASQQAQKEGRYFNREETGLKERYQGNEEEARKDLTQFLEGHGYHLREGIKTSERDPLTFNDLAQVYEHESEVKEDSIPKV